MSTTPKGVADHPAKDLILGLWEQGLRAAEIEQELEDRGLPLIKRATLARYCQRYATPSQQNTITIEQDGDLESVEEAIKTVSAFGEVKSAKFTHKTTMVWEKDEDGNNRQVPKELSTHVIDIVPFSDEDNGTEVKIEIGPFNINSGKGKLPPNKPAGFNTLIAWPDTQMGYYRDSDGNIHPIQDEVAIDVALQISVDIEEAEGVETVVNAGDDLDLPDFSSHRSSPGYFGNLEAAFRRHKTHLAMQRDVHSNAEIVQLYGNHEARLEKFLVDKAPQLLGLRKVDSEEPLLSIPEICGYDEFNITRGGPYPHGEWWANDHLKFVHGTSTSAVPGGALAKNLKDHPGVSVVYGHDHYQAVAYDRIHDRYGSRTIFAASAGCLCRVDGLVPSSKSAIRPSGALVSEERWTQGILVIHYEPEGSQRAFVEPVLISDGEAIFRGKHYYANR